MRSSVFLSLLGFILFSSVETARAAEKNVVRGAVITPDGKTVPEFSVAAKPIGGSPGLVIRRQFREGVFTLEGLPDRKYEIVVQAKRYVNFRYPIDFDKDGGQENFRLIMLYPFRNEVRYLDDSSYSVSAAKLQQRIPDQAKKEYLRAVEFHRNGELDDAMRCYGKAISAFPYYVEALADVGGLYILLNDPTTGLRYLQRALSVDKNNPVIHINMAAGYMVLGEFDEASRILQKLVQTATRKSLPRYYLAKLLFYRQEYAAAEDMIKLALQDDSEMLDGWILLLNIAIARKDDLEVRQTMLRIDSMIDSKAISSFISQNDAARRIKRTY
jgi:Flp pilus assembly protein TadD